MTASMPRFELRHWEEYNANQGARPVRDLCRRVLALAGDGEGRAAVDLGAGAGIETAAMLAAGWHVTAIEPASGSALTAVPDDVRPALVHRPAFAQDALPLPHAHLVHASYTLPYVPVTDFDHVWAAIRDALLPGGFLAVTLFGPHDTWATDPSIAPGRLTFHSRGEVEQLLAGLDVVDLTEEDDDGMSASGPKHWHVFEAIARRPE
ncbi:class I SAM-dependent methyltransferase [Antribacter gilvus]|uniref:class I SAM-dependent methyltransferase n=1 Tax=Antribacter gilvus TaxID=2304675 RepID=UPI001F0BBF31|nr:methyltransferase domain-containing protein [Antribacter gilvus]